MGDADEWDDNLGWKSQREPDEADYAAMSADELRRWVTMWRDGCRYWERVAQATQDKLYKVAPPRP